MKNIFSGSFEQVEDAISKNFATNAIVVYFIGLASYGVCVTCWTSHPKH